jgi:mitochondrial fission protein ELM1
VTELSHESQAVKNRRGFERCIWRFFDGRAGHHNQVVGLTDALSRTVPVTTCDVDVTSDLKGFRSLLPWRLKTLRGLPVPDLLIGAGHSTHVPLLAARRHFGGRAVVLMKPSLPLRLFDLCCVPESDGLRSVSGNVVLTEGVLNRIRPAKTQHPQQGLMLIGGPSKHFGWSDERVLSQLRQIIRSNPLIQWTLTTSRRTPDSFVRLWQSARLAGHMVPVEQTSPEWVPQQLQQCSTVWVTCESVSMVFEALTSGARVGILDLPEPRSTRVAASVQSLISRGIVTPFQKWSKTGTLQSQTLLLDEASRIAAEISRRFVNARPSNQKASQRDAA